MNQHLASVLAEIFGIRADQVTLELTKDTVGSWDSLKQMDLVMTLEREYAIALEIADIVRMDSVANIADVLKDKGVDFGT
jgi:acyl carrier protein